MRTAGMRTGQGHLKSTFDSLGRWRAIHEMIEEQGMKTTHSLAVSRSMRVLALLCLGSVLGCRGGVSMGIAVPKKIVDLSPAITEDLPVRQFGHRACEFLGLKERISFTPVAPQKETYAFGLTYFELASNLGAHLDAPARLLKGGQRADQVPLEKLYGRARVVNLQWM